MAKLTRIAVNRELRAAGLDCTLVHGKGYWYFVGDGVDYCYTTSVYCYHLNAYPLEHWVQIARSFVEESTSKRPV